MKRTAIWVGGLSLLLGCGARLASDGQGRGGREGSAGASIPAVDAITDAERALDRGQDAAAQKSKLEIALGSTALTADDRSRAIVALSRAEEALGNRERAIQLVEDELAAHENDREWTMARPTARRLRKLLTGSEKQQGPDIDEDKPVAPFAHVLLKYFQPAADGSIHATFYIAGSMDMDGSDPLGLLNLGGAQRAEQEKSCPLCDADVNVQNSTHESDWLLIPRFSQHFGEAMTIFFFDLGRGRIPERYESFLPMKVADIVRELEAGKSFAVAKERPGAPPTLLVAAPRTAMLLDAEQKLAELTALPLSPVYFDVDSKLRPSEIRAVVRPVIRREVKGCYEALLAARPAAAGKVDWKLAVDDAGRVTDAAVEPGPMEPGGQELREPAFVDCVKRAGGRLVFPATGQKATMIYPISVSPGDVPPAR